MATAILQNTLLNTKKEIPAWVGPLTSIGVHAAIYGSLVLFLSFGFMKKPDAPLADVSVDYEMLNEAPTPTEVVKRVQRAPEPETPVQQKTVQDNTPKEMQDDKGAVAGTQTKAPAPQAAIGSDSNGSALSTPYYKVKPKYPRPALLAGTEGWVLLKVDVNEDGGVENVRIVGGEQRNLFGDEARRAVEKWKYKPFLAATGKPIKITDHEVRVDFKLTDAVASNS